MKTEELKNNLINAFKEHNKSKGNTEVSKSDVDLILSHWKECFPDKFKKALKNEEPEIWFYIHDLPHIVVKEKTFFSAEKKRKIKSNL